MISSIFETVRRKFLHTPVIVRRPLVASDNKMTPPTERVSSYNTAQEIADYIREQLEDKEPHYDHIIRVLTTEVYRWFSQKFTPEELDYVMQDYGTTTWETWDALLEAVVLYNCHKYGKTPPKWAYRTYLDSAFSPRDYRTTNLDQHMRRLFDTPVEILDKGVIFSETEAKQLTLLSKNSTRIVRIVC
jgi:hypothetical protein